MKSSLERAARLYRLGKYAEIIRLLEPQIYKYRESPGFYKLLGLSCLYAGDMSGSSSYLRRGLQLKDDDVELLLGLAAYHVKRQQAGEAIQLWFDVLDIDPGNKTAKYGLDVLKRNAEPGRLADFAASPKYYAILPGNKRSEKTVSRIIAITGIVAVIGAAGFVLYRFWPNQTRDVPDISISDTVLLDPDPESALYTLDENEVREAMESAKRYFMDFRDNLAQTEINTVKYSNASLAVKDQARLLESYLSEPDFVTFRDNIPYQTAARALYQYSGCYVLWQGRVSNLTVNTSSMTFDLLVGYQDGRVLDGIVPAFLSFVAEIKPASAVEVLGQIVVTGEKMTLRVVSLRQIVGEGDR